MQYSDGGAPPVMQPAQAAARVTGGLRLGSTTWMALGIGAIVVVATAIVLLGGNRQPSDYAANSPEGTVQRYLTAWYDADYESAYSFFSAPVRAQMSLEDFTSYSYANDPGTSSQTVSIDRITGEGDRRTVYLTVEEYYGPQPGNSYSRDASMRLVLEDGAWRIDEPLTGVDPYYGSF